MCGMWNVENIILLFLPLLSIPISIPSFHPFFPFCSEFQERDVTNHKLRMIHQVSLFLIICFSI